MLSLTLRGNKALCNGRQLLFFYQHSQPILRYKMILFYLLFLILIFLFKKNPFSKFTALMDDLSFFQLLKLKWKYWPKFNKVLKKDLTYHCAETGSNPPTYGPNQLINHFQIKGLSAFFFNLSFVLTVKLSFFLYFLYLKSIICPSLSLYSEHNYL